MTNTAAAHRIPTPGHPVRHRAGRFVIEFSATDTGAFLIRVERASTGAEIDEWRRTWPTYAQARDMARNAYRVLSALAA